MRRWRWSRRRKRRRERRGGEEGEEGEKEEKERRRRRGGGGGEGERGRRRGGEEEEEGEGGGEEKEERRRGGGEGGGEEEKEEEKEREEEGEGEERRSREEEEQQEEEEEERRRSRGGGGEEERREEEESSRRRSSRRKRRRNRMRLRRRRRRWRKREEQLAKERQVSGRIQLQVYYNDEKNEIVVSVLAADDLAARDETCGYGNLPEAYVQLRLLPFTGDMNCMKTEIAEPATNPIWNTTVDVANVSGDQLLDKTIEVTLWDSKPDKEQVFLGETTIDLQKALMDDRPVWYRLEDPRQLRGGGGANKSPRGSIQGDANTRGLQKRDTNRSMSEDRDSEADIGEGLSLLHPDHAYLSGSRRGSSQSEQLEVETYQLNKDFSRSLPGSRRSSLLSGQEKTESVDPDIPPATYSKSRRRSSCTPRQDPDEILRNLKAVKGELMSQNKGRSMSICAESTKRLLRRGSTRKARKESCIELSNAPPIIAGASKHSPLDEDEDYNSAVKLGPGQIQPRGYRLVPGGFIELKIGLILTKGQLEVEVISARGIPSSDPQPDTYVKTYLRDRDNDRWIQKRKTRVVRNSTEPAYKQTLKYNGNELSDRSLLVMLWERQKGFEHNQGMGGAEIALNSVVNSKINSTLSVGWYPLFPIHTLGSDSNDSP
ncbi:hypothetical protein WDU94_006063 [Cyamophila willieti]